MVLGSLVRIVRIPDAGFMFLSSAPLQMAGSGSIVRLPEADSTPWSILVLSAGLVLWDVFLCSLSLDASNGRVVVLDR